MAGEIRLILDGAAMAKLLRSPSGPVGRDLIERSERVRMRAKEIIAPHSRTGCLSDSVVKRMGLLGDELAVTIKSDTAPCSPKHESYSLFVHEGTAPHVISASNGGVLAFPWHGEMAFFTSVHHPGTKPVPFLRDALPAAA